MKRSIFTGTVAPYLLSERHALPDSTEGFDASHYRYGGQTWPLAEFDGVFQLYRYAVACPYLPRPLAPGDMLLVCYRELNRISSLVVMDRRAPLLWNRQRHTIYEGDPDEPILLRLPRALRPGGVTSV